MLPLAADLASIAASAALAEVGWQAIRAPDRGRWGLAVMGVVLGAFRIAGVTQAVDAAFLGLGAAGAVVATPGALAAGDWEARFFATMLLGLAARGVLAVAFPSAAPVFAALWLGVVGVGLLFLVRLACGGAPARPFACTHCYRVIGAASFDTVVITDEEGQILHWSAAAERMFGYRALEVEGRIVYRLIGGPSAGAGSSPARSLVMEHTAQRRDGSTFPAEIVIRPLRMPGKARILVVVRDVSERHKLQAADRRRLSDLRAMRFRVGPSSRASTRRTCWRTNPSAS